MLITKLLKNGPLKQKLVLVVESLVILQESLAILKESLAIL